MASLNEWGEYAGSAATESGNRVIASGAADETGFRVFDVSGRFIALGRARLWGRVTSITVDAPLPPPAMQFPRRSVRPIEAGPPLVLTQHQQPANPSGRQLSQIIEEVAGSSTAVGRQLTELVEEVVGSRDEANVGRQLSQIILEVVVIEDVGWWEMTTDETEGSDTS